MSSTKISFIKKSISSKGVAKNDIKITSGAFKSLANKIRNEFGENYILLDIIRKSNHPDDGCLYIVTIFDGFIDDYIVIGTWNCSQNIFRNIHRNVSLDNLEKVVNSEYWDCFNEKINESFEKNINKYLKHRDETENVNWSSSEEQYLKNNNCFVD